jgi:hypothetical protein
MQLGDVRREPIIMLVGDVFKVSDREVEKETGEIC